MNLNILGKKNSIIIGLSKMNYPEKTGFNLYQSRHSAYIIYSVKTLFWKNLSVSDVDFRFMSENLYVEDQDPSVRQVK